MDLVYGASQNNGPAGIELKGVRIRRVPHSNLTYITILNVLLAGLLYEYR